MKLEVSRIYKLDGRPTKAFVDLVVEDMFVIKGVRVIEGEKGLFISLPKEQGKDGKWYSIVVPLSSEIKDELERVVLEAYGS